MPVTKEALSESSQATASPISELWPHTACFVAPPLMGLALSLPGGGLIGFAAVAAFWVVADLFLPSQDLFEPPTGRT